jgi:hypothetical protein
MKYTYKIFYEENKSEFIVIEYEDGRRNISWYSVDVKNLGKIFKVSKNIESFKRTTEWLKENHSELLL